MSKNFFLLLGFVFLSFSLNPLVVESNKIMDVLKYVEKGTLVILDIDGVAMEPLGTLGSDPWAYYEGDKYIVKHDGDVVQGLEDFAPIWTFVQKNIWVKLVDKNFLSLLKKLKESGYVTMGFTARGIDLVERTKEQLGSIGVDLAKLSFNVVYSVKNLYCFKYGILFANVGCNKGDCLETFLQNINFLPKKIILADDRKKNILTLEEMCKKHDIPYVGILYGGASITKENFDPKIGDLQLQYLQNHGKVMSDKQAEVMLQENKLKQVFTSL